MKSVFNRLLRSTTITTWFSYASKALNLVVILPLLLKKLPTTDINFWYLFSNIIFLQLILDAGLSSNFIRMFSYAFVGNREIIGLSNNSETTDNEFVFSLVHLMRKIYRNMIFFVVALFLTLGYFAFHSTISLSSNIYFGWFTWLLILLALPIMVFGGVYSNIIQGFNEVAKLRIWETVFNLISSLVSIAILLFYPNVYFLVISVITFSVFSVIRNYFLAKETLRDLNGNVNLTLVEKIKHDITGNSIKSGLGVLFSQGITFVISFFYVNKLEEKDLAMYLILLNIVLNIKNFAQAPFYSKIPYFSSLIASNKFDILLDKSRTAMRQVYGSFIFLSLIIWLIINYYFEVYGINSISKPNFLLWLFLCFGFFIERFGAMHIQLYSMSNHVLWHIHNGVTGLITILSTFIFFKLEPLYSYPIGLLIGNILFYSWYGPFHSYKFFGLKFWKFEGNTFVLMAGIYILLFACLALLNTKMS